MSTINHYESLKVTNHLQSKNLIVDEKIATTSIETNSVLTTNISGVNFYGNTFYGNVVGTVNGLVGDTVLSNDKLKWDDTSSRVQNLSTNWQESYNKTSNWSGTIEQVEQNIQSWDSAYSLSHLLQQDFNSFKYKSNVTITQDLTVTGVLGFKRLLVNSEQDVILTFKDNISDSVEFDIVQLGAGKVFIASDNENSAPILSQNNFNCLNKKHSKANMLKLPNGWLLTGDAVFATPDSSEVFYWYSDIENDSWFNVSNWYYDSKHTLATNMLPTSSTHVRITGKSPLLKVSTQDLVNWVEPKSIDNRLSQNVLTISSDNTFTLTESCILSATNANAIVFTGFASMSSSTYYWYRNTLETSSDWFNKDCWYINENVSIRGNKIPDYNNIAIIIENNNINYIANPVDPNDLPVETSLPTIVLNDQNVTLFASPSVIDFTRVINTPRFHATSDAVVTFTFDILFNSGFDIIYTGDIITS